MDNIIIYLAVGLAFIIIIFLKSIIRIIKRLPIYLNAAKQAIRLELF